MGVKGEDEFGKGGWEKRERRQGVGGGKGERIVCVGGGGRFVLLTQFICPVPGPFCSTHL